MAEIRNSEILEALLGYAKERTGGKNAVSAEAYLTVLIDIASGGIVLGDEKAANAICRAMDGIGTDLKALKENLRAYVASVGVSYADAAYMSKRMYAARLSEESRKQGELTPEILLKYILEEPSEAIRSCMKGEAPAASEKKGDKETRAADIARIIAEMKKGKGLSVEKKEDADEDHAEPESPEEREIAQPTKDDLAALTERVKDIHDELSSEIFGQDNAISVFTTGLFQSELRAMTDLKRFHPRATYLFAGPPGVGKTFLAESGAKLIGRPFKRFDMSEYSDHESVAKLCGTNKVFKDSAPGILTTFVKKNPECILLFDEIEKANITAIHLFLQILDAGRLTDAHTEKEVSFKDAIIIFTTNAGKQLYEEAEEGDFSGLSRKVILKALQDDVNAMTGVPFFPPAICSRFASGNVVMFNHLTANYLYRIARKEVLRHANNFEDRLGITIDIDERVYSALIFAEGGAADARTVRARSEIFFNDELFELFRMTASAKAESDVADIERINITIELPQDKPEVSALFESVEKQKVLLFSKKDIDTGVSDLCEIVRAKTLDAAIAAMKKGDIGIVVIDVAGELDSEKEKYLNIEDVESEARDFFKYMRANMREKPVYLMEGDEYELDDEECTSYFSQGARGVLSFEDGMEELDGICKKLYQQASMLKLARENKLVTFETAQALSDGGRSAEIKLFDFALDTAISAEDSQNVLSNISKPDVTFDQVIGAEEAKKELRQFVQQLKDPQKFRNMGVSAPRGMILYGPPGTGKTMLAKAMAGEADMTFITAEGNQFLKKYVGEGPEKVHELFRCARRYAPSIIFIDEIDAIAKERRGTERDAYIGDVLTAFLTEMDGFKNNSSKPVFVLAATNFNVEPGTAKSLDPALMRRFDRRIYIDLPRRDDRIKYMKLKISKNRAFAVSDEQMDSIAMRSTGMSIAELESVFELALRTAIRNGLDKVTDEILDEAFETFNGGEEKKWDAALLERTARHEAGHAFMCWHSGELPSYLTIVARGNHGGYMRRADNEDKALYTKDELLGRIRTSLAGRAAEIVCYGDRDGMSTGAGGDLENATRLARHLICSYGMDENFGLAVIEQQSAITGELAGEVRAAVNGILDTELKAAVEIIRQNRKTFDALVENLMVKNNLTGDEMKEIFTQNA